MTEFPVGANITAELDRTSVAEIRSDLEEAMSDVSVTIEPDVAKATDGGMVTRSPRRTGKGIGGRSFGDVTTHLDSIADDTDTLVELAEEQVDILSDLTNEQEESNYLRAKSGGGTALIGGGVASALTGVGAAVGGAAAGGGLQLLLEEWTSENIPGGEEAIEDRREISGPLDVFSDSIMRTLDPAGIGQALGTAAVDEVTGLEWPTPDWLPPTIRKPDWLPITVELPEGPNGGGPSNQPSPGPSGEPSPSPGPMGPPAVDPNKQPTTGPGKTPATDPTKQPVRAPTPSPTSTGVAYDGREAPETGPSTSPGVAYDGSGAPETGSSTSPGVAYTSPGRAGAEGAGDSSVTQEEIAGALAAGGVGASAAYGYLSGSGGSVATGAPTSTLGPGGLLAGPLLRGATSDPSEQEPSNIGIGAAGDYIEGTLSNTPAWNQLVESRQTGRSPSNVTGSLSTGMQPALNARNSESSNTTNEARERRDSRRQNIEVTVENQMEIGGSQQEQEIQRQVQRELDNLENRLRRVVGELP